MLAAECMDGQNTMSERDREREREHCRIIVRNLVENVYRMCDVMWWWCWCWFSFAVCQFKMDPHHIIIHLIEVCHLLVENYVIQIRNFWCRIVVYRYGVNGANELWWKKMEKFPCECVRPFVPKRRRCLATSDNTLHVRLASLEMRFPSMGDSDVVVVDDKDWTKLWMNVHVADCMWRPFCTNYEIVLSTREISIRWHPKVLNHHHHRHSNDDVAEEISAFESIVISFVAHSFFLSLFLRYSSCHFAGIRKCITKFVVDIVRCAPLTFYIFRSILLCSYVHWHFGFLLDSIIVARCSMR